MIEPEPTTGPWARLRHKAPMLVFSWHPTEADARQAIDDCATKLGDQIRAFQTVAYFPDHPA